jgi:DNA-binding MarR family transcriptional regulator
VSILSIWHTAKGVSAGEDTGSALRAPAVKEVPGPMKPRTGNDVVDALLYAAHRVRNAADATLRDRGLSLQSYKLMRALEHSDHSMREVSEILHISPRTVTDMADGLETRGLISRGPHPLDRRVTLLHLTEDGGHQLAAAAALAEQSHNGALAGLTQQDQQVLRRLLDRVASAEEARTP